MDTDRAQRELENSGSWQLVDGRWLWWNGKRYTTEWNGTSYVPLSGTNAKTANVGMVLFLITAVLLWTPGAITGPVIVALGARAHGRGRAAGDSTTFATVVIVLGAIAFLMGLIMVALTSDPDFSM